MFDDMQAWLAFAGLAISNFVTWRMAQVKSQSDIKTAVAQAQAQAQAAHVEHRGPEWQTFVQEMRADFERRLAAQDAKIDQYGREKVEQDRKIATLTGELLGLQENIADFQHRYRLALDHIGEWRGHHPETVELIEVHPDLARDLAA